ncbi:MAG: SMC family ATPase [Armatimonadota bacterium]|nr:SMC family ATPase [bacterium]
MKLISLELKNFRQHVDSAITFTDGVTGIIGPNGSGKSTVLEALAWALYGAPAVRGTNDTIRTKGGEGGAKVNVTLTFELGGSIYRVVRTLDGSGRSGSAVLEVDGRALRSGMSEVSDAITKLLGMDYRAFFTSFFTGQKALEFMAAMDGRARAAAIGKMLGYDRVTKARDRANEDRKGLSREIEGLEKGLADPEELKERKKTAQARLSAAKSALEEAEKTRKRSAEAVDKLKPLKEASDQKAKRFEDISRRLELDRADIKRSETRLAQLQTEFADLEAKQKELDSLKSKLDDYEQAKVEYRKLSELQKHEGDRQRLAGQIGAIEQDIKRLQAREKSLTKADEEQMRASAALVAGERALAKTDEILRTLRERKVAVEHSTQAQIKQLEFQRGEVDSKRARIAEAGAEGACPTCERPLGDELPAVLAGFDSQLREIDGQIALLRDVKLVQAADSTRIDRIEDSRDKVVAQVEQLRNEKSAADALVAERKTVADQLKSRKDEQVSLIAQIEAIPGGFDQAKYAELRRLGDELRPIHDRAIALKSALDRLPVVRTEIAEITAACDAKKNEIAGSEKSLAELAFSPKEREELIRKFEAASSSLGDSALQLERQMGEVKVASTMLTAVEREEDQYKSKLENLKQKRSERMHLEIVAQAMDRLRAELNDRIRPELEAIASELLSMMTDGRYNTLEINDSYQATIRDDGELKPVISGGEDDIVNLALRLAISQMIADRAGQSFSLLILDEVFGSLDDVRRDNVVSLLQNLKNRFEQIILITHVESIHDAVDNCLWVTFDERTKTSRLIDRIEQPEVGIATVF